MKKNHLFKFAVMALVALFAFAMAPQTADAQTAKQAEKIRKKAFDEKIKQWKKEGWQIEGSRTLDLAVLEHMEALKDVNNREMIGSVTSCKSKNVCQQWAQTNAITKYANEAKSHVMGRVANEVGAGTPLGELDDFYAGYERLVSASIGGELKLSFAISKKNSDGTMQYDAYYLINEDQASKSRMKAMENALKESEAAQKHAKQISDFVREGFQQ